VAQAVLVQTVFAVHFAPSYWDLEYSVIPVDQLPIACCGQGQSTNESTGQYLHEATALENIGNGQPPLAMTAN